MQQDIFSISVMAGPGLSLLLRETVYTRVKEK